MQEANKVRQRGERLPPSQHMLNAVSHVLREVILPEVASQRSRTLLQMTDLLLRHVQVREEQGTAEILQLAMPEEFSCADHRDVETNYLHLLHNVSNAALPAMERAAFRRALLAGINAEGAALRRFTQMEENREELGLDAEEAARFVVTPQRVTRYLQNHVPGFAHAEVTGIEQVVGGLSKETFIIELIQEGARSGIVMRRDIPNPPIESSAADELAVLSPLFAQGLEVPEPLWAEPDPVHFGMPFLISRKVGGQAISGAVEFRNLPDSARRNGELLAQFLGRLHGVDIASVPLGFVAGLTGQDYVRRYVKQWESWWRANQMEPCIILSTAYSWLFDNVPRDVAPVVVHGDAGLHNLMIENDHVSAMIDWELVHIGDASEDLMYCRHWVDQVMPFENFLQIYNEFGGAPIHPESARYYRLLSSVRNVTCTIAQMRGFRDAALPLLPSAFSGIRWYKHYLQAAAEDLEILIGGAEQSEQAGR